MVVLVPVDERLTGPGAPGLAELRTVGVEPLVDAVLRSEGPDEEPFGAPAACDTPAGGLPHASIEPCTFLAVDPRDHQVVGTCGFRGPLRGGRVEIAFWTFPPFEGRGWATAMTRALVARAFADPAVQTVVAHTLPERAPAASVLTANGLVRVQSRRRDEQGPGGARRGKVWRWESHRPMRAPSPTR
ncbi:GNAT family N-acetyltransferase [Actinomycetospora lemnae]|uniref:GNAT family N-acetyltransferase n=1 Tax=Actinomycetospora lemnae TaxID=3019891 RepID=A0ABT5SQX7_9PSEU|nr:GNAT family N-acetyltransferase [Actinomycetospora sp. DW7H6]MDD7965194.1 GNAT family N-acetyltransferase [Actinomycetospora sp. DW7H6]